MEVRRKLTAVMYIAAIAIAVSVIYLAGVAESQPQPLVHIDFNYTGGTAIGYINNTLDYPIYVSYVYCTLPGGRELKFNHTASNPIPPGTSAPVALSVNANSSLPLNCTLWRASFSRAYNTTTIP